MDPSGPIQVAKDAPESIKEKLIFRNEDELDTGMQKVQPLPFLDEEIHKHVKMIKDCIPNAQQVRDDVPQRALGIVETVIREANTGQTTLFKASDLLEVTADAFKYARGACCDNFRLERKSTSKLREYDEMFKQVIEHRIGKKMSDSQKAMKRCRELLERAVAYAEGDREKLAGRVEKEDMDVSADQLDDTSVTAQDNIRDERGELDMIKQQCQGDITNIENEVELFHMRMDSLESQERKRLGKQEGELRRNQKRQEEIRRELRELEAEEKRLTHDIRTIEDGLVGSSQAREEADIDIKDWKVKIKGLERRTDTALNIMTHMKECTDLIMSNAKEKKKEWKRRLEEMDLISLLDYRDALLAQAVFYTVIKTEANKNSEMAAQQLERLEEEQEEAAQTGFSVVVDNLTEKIDKFTKQIKQFQKEIEEMGGLLAEVTGKVEEVDTKIRQLRPSIKLDALDDQYDERSSAMKQSFRKKGTDTVRFNSVGNYN